MAFNLTRATGSLASTVHAKATTATLRTQLINIAARIATSGRRTTLHLPTAWPWATEWQHLFTARTAPGNTRRGRTDQTGQGHREQPSTHLGQDHHRGRLVLRPEVKALRELLAAPGGG